MNVNQKIFLLVQMLFFIFPMIGLQNSFGSDDDSALNETIIKITDTEAAPGTMIFKAPGEQWVTIENNLDKDVDVNEHVIFIGDDFMTTGVARGDISTSGGCISIPAGQKGSFKVDAAKNAIPSINPEGEQFLLHYQIHGEGKDKFIAFKIKIDYNNDVTFAVRNLDFGIGGAKKTMAFLVPPMQTWLQPQQIQTKKLTIKSRDPLLSVGIKDVRLGKDKDGVRVGEYRCSNSFCEVDVTINNPKDKSDVIPIYVTYDMFDKDGQVVKEDLMAIAAAIIDLPSDDEVKTNQDGTAVVAGLSTDAVIQAIYVKQFARTLVTRLLVTVVGNRGVAYLTDPTLGVLAGAGCAGAGKLTPGYNYGDLRNKAIQTVALHAALGVSDCGGRSWQAVASGFVWSDPSSWFLAPVYGVASYIACVTPRIVCGLISSFGAQLMTDIVYSNTVIRLPEQNQGWFGWLGKKSQSAVTFASAAVIRVACDQVAGVKTYGYQAEVVPDFFSGFSIDYVNGLLAAHPELALPKNGTVDFNSKCVRADSTIRAH